MRRKEVKRRMAGVHRWLYPETPTGWQVSRQQGRQQGGRQCNGWPLSGVQSGFDTLRRVKLRLLDATLKGAHSPASQSRGSWWSHMRAAIYRPDTNAEKIHTAHDALWVKNLICYILMLTALFLEPCRLK
jgi:hypothetical protein